MHLHLPHRFHDFVQSLLIRISRLFSPSRCIDFADRSNLCLTTGNGRTPRSSATPRALPVILPPPASTLYRSSLATRSLPGGRCIS
ncbi:MAG: hypothetical protein F9K32_02975 [Desulfobulbaceae bacterium]|nr:MAG: hypothetical protein F9K32_02975 [Desulfobulbaceae bacterium]